MIEIKNPKMWKLLLKALDVKESDIVCRYCGKKLKIGEFTMFPSDNPTLPVFVCANNFVCMVKYFEEFGKKMEERKKEEVKK